jgi:XTP/dITP diphosphohydrolase
VLEPIGLRVIALDQVAAKVGSLVVEETGTTFEENALIKAREYGRASGYITLADDSGLVVDALDGKPGIYSARYGNSDTERNTKLLEELIQVPDGQRTARFTAVIAVFDPATKTAWTVKGTCEGKIGHRPKGQGGFGYDPVFFSTDLEKTFAEATMEEKNQVSHRGKALEKAREKLENLDIKSA